MVNKRNRRRSIPLLLVAALVAVVGVSGVSAQSKSAMVRIVHASPDAPAVDIWVNGEVAIEELAFGEVTEYVSLDGGDYDVAVTPAGGEAADAVIQETLTLENGMAYTVAAAGQLAEIEALVLQDNLGAPETDNAHVRVVHASPDAPAVDVAVSGGPVLIENLEFKSDSGYLSVEAMTYDLEVRPTGTEDVAIDIPGFNAEAGTVYTVFALGLASDGSLSVLPLVDVSHAESTGDGAAEAPSMPDTGAGGAEASSMSNATILAVLVTGVVIVGGGVFLFASRQGNAAR